MREMMMIAAAVRGAALVAALSFQSSSADFMYNVRSAADALVVGRAASEEGAVVHAYWSGSVVLHRPIKVGTATRLTILGSGEGQARILYTPRAAAGTAPAGAAGILGGDGLAAEAIDIDNSSSIGPVGKNVVVGDGDRPAPGGAVFEVGEGASLVLKKIAVLSALPSSSGGGGGGGRPALLNLLPDSFVQARACHFGMTESGGGENNGESPYALAPALAPAPAPVTMMTMMRVARGALLHLADGCSLVLDHPPVETSANVGEPVSSTDTSSDSGGWAGAAIVVERGGEMQVESTYFQGVFREDEAAKPVASWTGTRVVEKAVERWDIPHEDEHMAPEHGRDAAGGPAAGRSAAFSASPAYLGAVAVGSVARRGLLVECSEGLFGDECSDCASGFVEAEGGGCEVGPSSCNGGNQFRAVLVVALCIPLFFLTLDALCNGKSPPRRVAQLWRRVVGPGPGDGADGHISDSFPGGRTRPGDGGGGGGANFSRGEGSDSGSWGRGGMGRFFQGLMVFVVTGQIITQGAKLVELEFPAAMERLLSGLQWTNLDPQSIVGTCVLPQYPFFDRVNGVVGLLTVSLISLVVSHVITSCCVHPVIETDITSSKSSGGGGSGSSSSSSSRRGGTGDSSLRQQQQKAEGKAASTQEQRLSAPFSHSMSKMERGSGHLDQSLSRGGVWDSWDRWSSAERHTCAGVVICLLMYPVVCTTLLRVLDCRTEEDGEGSWLRADTNVECKSGQHRAYQTIAAVFLGLYGLGLPLSLGFMLLWAKGGDDEDEREQEEAASAASAAAASAHAGEFFHNDDEDNDDDDDTTVAVRRLRGGALLQGHREEGGGHGGGRGSRGATPIRIRGARGGRVGAARSRENSGGPSAFTVDGGDGRGTRVRVPAAKSGGQLPPAGAAAAAAVDRPSARRGERGHSDAFSDTSARGGRGGGGGGDCCRLVSKSKAWRASGRWVLAARRAMSSKPDSDLWEASPSSPAPHKRWRSTIALWSPYRSNRQWFAAWELARRLLLTGLLTAVSPDRSGEQYLRAAVACVLSGASLLVGEVARPHKDPWIRWIYRMGGVVIFLVNLAGLIQKAGGGDAQSAIMVIFTVLLIFLILTIICCVCGGWRLSCAEQGSSAAAAAAIIPRGRSAGSLFPPTVARTGGPGNRDNPRTRPPAASDADGVVFAPVARKNDKAPPLRMWSSEHHRLTGAYAVSRGGGGGARVVGNDSAKDVGGGGGGGGSVRNSLDRAHLKRLPSKRLPSYEELLDYGNRDGKGGASRSHQQKASADSQIEMMNPMFSSIGGGGGGGGYSSEREGSDGGRGERIISDGPRGGLRNGPFDRYMLSKSPREPVDPAASGFNGSDSNLNGSGTVSVARSGNGSRSGLERAADIAGVFNSVSGPGSVSMKYSIDAHLTASGRFYSNTEAINVSAITGPAAAATVHDPTVPWVGSGSGHGDENLDGDEDLRGYHGTEVVGARPRGRTAELSSASSGSTKRRGSPAAAAVKPPSPEEQPPVAAAAAAAASATTRLPVLAPGAPTFAGHARRFGEKKIKRSSSSFASTSFESVPSAGRGHNSSRKRREEQARIMASWRRSTSSNGLAYSRSRSISRVSVSSGEGSTGAAAAIGGGASRARGMLLRRYSSDASGSFLSQGSSSVASWVSPVGRGPRGPPPMKLRSRSSGHIQLDFEGPAFSRFPAVAEGPDGVAPIVGDSSNLGSNWVPTQTARSGWPLDLPASSSSAMPKWYSSRSGGDSSQSDLSVGAPPDLVLAAAVRAKAAEREAAAARVEAVFGDENHDNDRRFCNADGGSNIVEFRAFVRAGGSGTSSFDSRGSGKELIDRPRSASPIDDESDVGSRDRDRDRDENETEATPGPARGGPGGPGGPGRKPTVRSRSSGSSAPSTATMPTPLTSAELKKHLDYDFEEDEELDEDDVSFVRVSERVSKINAKAEGTGGRGGSQMPPPPSFPHSRGTL